MIQKLIQRIISLFRGREESTVDLTEQETVDLDEVPEIEVQEPKEVPPPQVTEPKRGITDQAFEQAATEIDVDVAKIKAVDEIESRGQGFLDDGRPKILFEAHWFGKFTDGKYNDNHPNISSPRWNRSLYKGGAAEHDRIQKAMELNREAALKSASWGRYQILGLNWEKCGYESLQSFINGMWKSESEHLRAFVGFVKYEGLDKPLRESDWRAFARGYNGPGYEKNNYHIKMKEAYEKYKS